MKLAPILTLAFSAITKPVLGECVTGITGFTLIAADSNTDIGTLAGMNFALNDPSFLYNIRADFKECNPGGTIESVRFFFDGVEERCKNVTPYGKSGCALQIWFGMTHDAWLCCVIIWNTVVSTTCCFSS